MKILIKVTKEVLRRSAYCESTNSIVTNCAIALAVRDIFPDAEVNHKRLYFFGGGNSFQYGRNQKIQHSPLPDVAADFIDIFDGLGARRRMSMKPISFEIEVPESVIEAIGLEEVHKILSESETLELVS